MRKLDRSELLPALRERDERTLKDHEAESLAVTLKAELDVTLLRAKQGTEIKRALNRSTAMQAKSGGVAVSAAETPVTDLTPHRGLAGVEVNEAGEIRVHEDDKFPEPEAAPREEPVVVTDTVPEAAEPVVETLEPNTSDPAPAAPADAPEEAQTAMAA